MSTSHDESHPEAIGDKVLTAAVASARNVWGERLIAAYTLGSLAHGGFSIHVSDIDLKWSRSSEDFSQATIIYIERRGESR